MTNAPTTHKPLNDESGTETVEALIRRAHTQLATMGRTASPSKVSNAVRRHIRDYGSGTLTSIIDGLGKPGLPTAAESFWYDLQTINNRRAVMPASYAAMPAVSRMRFGGDTR